VDPIPISVANPLMIKDITSITGNGMIDIR
jgi:hypothetical protein